ncbi:acetyltransferase [Pontibacter actiniarum]|uniref:PglD N-terminal domain-containing protein n=1 Tax=Pontibacter actiniarum TaxID=323450 RepID=A0A1X9YTH9_9BACT|nr:acetyltransferase [Pontibacter actiniarum]ARS36177.1 hypothetical protein CA264_12455 [Pontibacter actiniarum]
MQRIVLIGYSGHAFVVADTVEMLGGEIVGYCDKVEAKRNPYSLVYLGDEQDATTVSKLTALEARFIVSIGNNSARRNLTKQLTEQGIHSISVIHPSAFISKLSTVGQGSFVSAGAIVNPMASIGMGAIINTSAVVEHECLVGDYAHIAPGAVLAGNVSIGEGSFIGANAVVKQGTSIGKNVVIGAGAVVVKDVPDNLILVGNPAVELKK